MGVDDGVHETLLGRDSEAFPPETARLGYFREWDHNKECCRSR